MLVQFLSFLEVVYVSIFCAIKGQSQEDHFFYSGGIVQNAILKENEGNRETLFPTIFYKLCKDVKTFVFVFAWKLNTMKYLEDWPKSMFISKT